MDSRTIYGMLTCARPGARHWAFVEILEVHRVFALTYMISFIPHTPLPTLPYEICCYSWVTPLCKHCLCYPQNLSQCWVRADKSTCKIRWLFSLFPLSQTLTGCSIGFCIWGQMTREVGLHSTFQEVTHLCFVWLWPHCTGKCPKLEMFLGKERKHLQRKPWPCTPNAVPLVQVETPDAKAHYHCNELHHPRVHILGHSGRWKSRRCWHRFAHRGSLLHTHSHLWKAEAHHWSFPQQNIHTN